MKILITGFDPFGGESTNPAWEAIKDLPTNISGFQIITKQIPTVFKKSTEMLLNYISEHNPDYVLCVGQAGGRYEISIEKVGINLDDARIPDNEGNQPHSQAIYPDGENAYFVKLPVKKMAKSVRDKGIPCTVSYTAGTFVCNHILYSLLHHIEKNNIAKAGGFIHVPFLPVQAVDKPNKPYMSSEMIKDGIIAIVESLTDGLEDIQLISGKIS